MTVCKILLFGLKPCDINSSTNERVGVQRQHSLVPTAPQFLLENTKDDSADADYLNLDIKPLLTPTNSRSSTSSDINHESSPIRVTIRETPRGRHHICISQTLLRTHTGHV